MLIYLLLVLLILIWMFSYFFSKKDILNAPSVLCIVFIISVLNAIINKDIWNFNMGERTFLVILLGVFSFCLFYYIVFYCLYNIVKPKEKTRLLEQNIYIENKKLFYFFLIELVGLILIYSELQGFAGDNIGEKIYSYRVSVFLNQESENRIPVYVQFFIDFCSSASMILIYKVLLDYFCKNIFNIKYIGLIFLSGILSMSTGGRGFSVFLIIATSVMSYIFYMKKHNWQFRLNLKKICILILLPTVLVFSFSTIGLLVVGRYNEFDNGLSIFENAWRLLSIYIGAPLKLLDLYLYTDYKDVGSYYPVIGAETFNNLYKWIGNKFDINYLNMDIVGSNFRYDNGFMLGNVYTMFKYYVADFGILGVIVLSGIMASIFAYMFFKIKYTTSKNKINYIIIIYSYIFISVALSFFSDWFYNFFITIGTLKTIIYWKIFEYFFVEKF